MKTAEWFACLDYGRFDILIPQSAFSESTYSLTPVHSQLAERFRCREVNLDQTIASFFNVDASAIPVTEIALKSQPPVILRTSIVPTVMQIQLSSIKFFSNLYKRHLKKNGILAARFADDRIQYLVDISRLIVLGGKP
ncbi:MAG: hypothetical protein J6S91_00160 [Treponema sp.]|nr:hypothetical protein [Treponema sp.]